MKFTLDGLPVYFPYEARPDALRPVPCSRSLADTRAPAVYLP